MVYPVPSGVALQIYGRGYKYICNFEPNAAEYGVAKLSRPDPGSRRTDRDAQAGGRRPS